MQPNVSYPFLQIIGVVSKAYGVYHIEVGSMQKVVWLNNLWYAKEIAKM